MTYVHESGVGGQNTTSELTRFLFNLFENGFGRLLRFNVFNLILLCSARGVFHITLRHDQGFLWWLFHSSSQSVKHSFAAGAAVGRGCWILITQSGGREKAPPDWFTWE